MLLERLSSLSSHSSFPLSFTLSFSPMWFFTSLPLIPHHPISTKFRCREILPRHLRVSICLLILCRDPEDIIASAPPVISRCFFSLPFPSLPIPSPHPLLSYLFLFPPPLLHAQAQKRNSPNQNLSQNASIMSIRRLFLSPTQLNIHIRVDRNQTSRVFLPPLDAHNHVLVHEALEHGSRVEGDELFVATRKGRGAC